MICKEEFKMNIMVAFNDGYAMPTKVMLKSFVNAIIKVDQF